MRIAGLEESVEYDCCIKILPPLASRSRRRSPARSDLPQDIASEYNVEQQEQQEMLEFFHKQLQFALVHSIKQAISDRITYLKKSKGYAAFAERNKDLII
jgi:hypothetical protein